MQKSVIWPSEYWPRTTQVSGFTNATGTHGWRSLWISGSNAALLQVSTAHLFREPIVAICYCAHWILNSCGNINVKSIWAQRSVWNIANVGCLQPYNLSSWIKSMLEPTYNLPGECWPVTSIQGTQDWRVLWNCGVRAHLFRGLIVEICYWALWILATLSHTFSQVVCGGTHCFLNWLFGY